MPSVAKPSTQDKTHFDPHQIVGTCCGQDWTPITCALSQTGPHWKAACGHCGKYFRFLPQRPEAFTMPFGTHKGQRVTDLWTSDPGYCTWLLDQPWLTPRLREVPEATRMQEGTR